MLSNTDKSEFSRVLEPPTFTLDQLKTAIGPELFKRNAFRSLYYFFQDIFIISALFWLVAGPLYNIMESFWYISYPIYFLVQGTLMWSLFVVGHDCGHGSFSESWLLNDVIGHLAHSPILVPYYPWKFSHAIHHANTGNIDADETYVALAERRYRRLPLYVRIVRYWAFPLGGFFLYLLFGMPRTYKSHVGIQGNLIKPDQQLRARVSQACFWAVAGLLAYLSYKTSIVFMFKIYFAPWLVYIAWISIVTHLHHTHPDVPWYNNASWAYLRGALSTVDRNYGIVEPIHHNIGTHVVHHIFSKIPHYNLLEASARIEPILGKYHRKSNESMLAGLVRIWKHCHWLPDQGDVGYLRGPFTKESSKAA